MAMKDWKKVDDDTKDFWKKEGVGKIKVRKDGKGWLVDIDTLERDTGTEFKTKQEALKFAREYMRTH
tara:strand:- start:5324 stop:5524 length:201 start_codon:yes stop_codon:yes gene_type:complete